ncbi:MAG TPA: glycoside hydrolase family 2 TIM barrel-domain containing protein, partial [Anaerolineae bacterium]|nr:glycoside hydrolase family 2 TIM barrel-domain containing protein [Anaerolineae bacterium]
GYDVIGNTPFEVDATNAVSFTGENRLDVRITDPVGNFSWNDNILMRWGKNLVPAVHGFGGITGPVIIRATDAIHVDDIYIQNKPNPKDVDVFITLGNSSGSEKKGKISLILHEWKKPVEIVWSKTIDVTVPPEGKEVSLYAKAEKAKLWELSGYRTFKQAQLYEASVRFESSDGSIVDARSQRFGFRWFGVGEKNGDQRFYLNGKRVFVMAAMTRGFWPKNGIFATPEMAKRDMEALVDLGYNMMLLHRAIGQPPVMDYADRMGLLTYEEPGGYRIMPNRQDNIDGPDDQARAWRKEKLRRMIIRDRSLPSMIIYNLKNEAREDTPNEYDYDCMKMVHDLDPSRILTYNSDRNVDHPAIVNIPDDPQKLWMKPYDNTFYYHGWWDQHHWFAHAGYVDDNYNHPTFYLRYNIVRGDSLNPIQKDEIIFWGEEGAFGTMVRLQKIKEELEITGATGFRELEHLDWFEAYDTFLDESSFRSAYPTVDDLTMSLGRNMHYFHGRSIENVRMSNIADAYNLNGWGSASTRTDIVDMYRNPTANPAILQHYTQPLYVAVKLREKVMPVGTVPIADFWIINEENLHGKTTLEIALHDPGGNMIFAKEFEVNIKGGEEFGQLLVEAMRLPAVENPGYYMLNARITENGMVKATGFDDIFAVDYMSSPRLSGNCAVIESDNTIKNFLKDVWGISARDYTPGDSALDYIIVGNHDLGDNKETTYNDVLQRVVDGTTVIILQHADIWAEQVNRVSRSQPPVYQGGGIIQFGNSGRHFVGKSKFLEGLPDAQGMNWEYQCFYYTRNVSGLRLHHWGSDTIVALGGQHTKEILSSLSRIPLGKGQIFLSTLDIIPALSSDRPHMSVAKKLFLNLLAYSK